MTDVVTSKNGIRIRLTDERWAHIVEEHNELAGSRIQVLETIQQPERILAGAAEELLAVRGVEFGKWLVVVYRELESVTRRIRSLDKRKQSWP